MYMEVKRMNNDSLIMQYDAQINRIEKEYREAQSRAKSLRKNLETIAEKTCNFKYAIKQLGGPNEIFKMSDGQLRDFIITNIIEQKQEFMQNIRELQQLYLECQRENQELASKVLSLQEALERNEGNNKILHASTPPPPTFSNSEEPSQDKAVVDDKLIMGGEVYDIARVVQRLTVYQEEIVKVMGEKGYSETAEIFGEVMKRIDIQETTLKNEMRNLSEKLVVESESISTFLRRNLSLYRLTQLGEAVYKRLTEKTPVKAQRDKLESQHSTLEHAYLIKDTASILETLGYTNVTYDSKDNQIQVAGGNRYVPDISADFSPTVKTYWECELGHHKNADFFEKLQKAAKVTDTLYVITPRKEVSDKMKKQIGRYKASVVTKQMKTQLIVFVGTISQLKTRQLFSNKDCQIKIG